MAQPPRDRLVGAFLRSRRRWSDTHVANATSILNRWTAWLAERGTVVADASAEDCVDYLAAREAAVAGSTAHKEYQMLRWLYEWLEAEEYLEPVVRAGRTIARPYGPMTGVEGPTTSRPEPDRVRRVEGAPYRRLMSSLRKGQRLDCRDGAVISLLWHTGPRRSEIARARLEDLDLRAGTLRIEGKFGRWRTLPLAAETVEWTDRYLIRRGDDTAPALFTAERAGSADEFGDGQLRPDALSAMLDRRCERLGIDRVSAHQFRRAAAGNLRARGVPDADVAVIMGWAPSTAKEMIARYTVNDAEHLALDAFHRTDPTARRRPPRLRVAG